MLADLAAYTLELDISHKHQLLDELDVDRRAMLLLEILDGRSRPSVSCERPSHSFPPDFSAN